MEEADDIVRNREHHDREDEQHADLGQPQAKLRRERPAANPFRDEKHRVPAVEHGNRQEVEHRQAHGEKREKPEKHDETEPRRLTRHARDGNRAADLFDRCASRDESSDAGHHDTDLVRRLPRAVHDGLTDGQALDYDIARLGADEAEDLGARREAIRFRRIAWRDADPPERVTANHVERGGPPRQLPEAVHEIAPGGDRIAVQPDDEIALPQAGATRRAVPHDSAEPSGRERLDVPQRERRAGGLLARQHEVNGMLATFDLDRRLGLENEVILEHVPRPDRVAVHAEQAVAATERREGLRARRQETREHGVDLRHGPRLRRDGNTQAGVEDKCEDDVHRHAGKNHGHPCPQRLVIERARGVDRHVRLAALELTGHAFFLEPGHLHVAAQRDPRDPVFGLAAAPPQQRAAESNRESQDLNPDGLGDDEMAELVYRHQDAEHHDERDDGQEHATSCASRRACASACNTSSSRLASPPRVSSATTRSMISAIRPNGIRSSRNSWTATSLAALNRAGAVPPTRAAARPIAYAGKRSTWSASNVRLPAATGSNRRTPWSGTRSG